VGVRGRLPGSRDRVLPSCAGRRSWIGALSGGRASRTLTPRLRVAGGAAAAGIFAGANVELSGAVPGTGAACAGPDRPWDNNDEAMTDAATGARPSPALHRLCEPAVGPGAGGGVVVVREDRASEGGEEFGPRRLRVKDAYERGRHPSTVRRRPPRNPGTGVRCLRARAGLASRKRRPPGPRRSRAIPVMSWRVGYPEAFCVGDSRVRRSGDRQGHMEIPRILGHGAGGCGSMPRPALYCRDGRSEVARG